ncbi:uncharacterized protein LOC123030759 isoform X1 [Varanus komodoensis]|uniref:uncharacterized protein LOC123030759 isoform X1 n=1 Tax=Varanus komodoensis TaxID=61221 RepID=UPI001CF771D7|nr:uncharacterized protein LOC123030759 isoform X1 [Varanus komodoensis]
MSGSTARKVQPFTISTKLSLPKCSLDFPGDGSPSMPISALDNRDLHPNLNERMSLYLAHASPVSPGGRCDSPSPVEEMDITEDGLNRNSLSRSIKKITLSNWHRVPGPGEAGMNRGPFHNPSERNCNNNNSRTGKAQFKVFLKKEVRIGEEKQEASKPQAGCHASVGRVAPGHMIAGCAAPVHWKEGSKNTQANVFMDLKPGIQSNRGPADLHKQSPFKAQFNCDIVQAEKWVQGKLRDLKDGCSIPEWERVAQTLQRDMKDFENAMIKLNQMGEELLVQPNPDAEIARRLQTLREQWQLLKQAAAKQSKAVGGLRSLQEFNQKAEQLEAWIRRKEEKPLIDTLLQENADKIQLTRRILDLKQEEQQFQVLLEEMNSLAHKLEKQGKSESRSITTRRKHLNKMWLQLQGTLKEHHETLQLALEAAAFLQQADVLLGAIHAKWRCLSRVEKQREHEPSPDVDVRDLASQVMMLDVSVSQLTSLHPSLVARLSLKHQDVKESWTQLQQLLRNEKPPLLALTRRMRNSPSPDQALTTTTSNAGREMGENPAWGAQKDIPESTAEHMRAQGGNSSSPGREAISSNGRRRRRLLRQANTLKDPLQPEVQRRDLGQVAGGELQQLLRADHRWSPQMEDALEELEDLWAELKRRHQENGAALREIDTALRLVGELEEAECWLGSVVGLLSEPRATKSLDDLRRDLQKIGTLENQTGAWRIKLRQLQEEMRMEPCTEHTTSTMIQRKMERVKEKLVSVQEALQRRASDMRDSLILTEFLQDVELEEMLSQRNLKQTVSKQLGSEAPLHLLTAPSAQQLRDEDISRPLEELQEAVQMLNDVAKERERAMEAETKLETLTGVVQALREGKESKLAWVTSRMDALRDKAETLAQDILQAERSFATVKSEQDLLEMQGLLERQKEVEHDMAELEGDMEELERTATQLKEHYPVQISDEPRRILERLEAWKDLQRLVLKNAVLGQQTVRLQQFFQDYLAMISWTEDTRAKIFSESFSSHGLSEAQWGELENNIETKLKEFEELAATGWELVAEGHNLSETIKERMEELQSMLGWVMVRWRAQSSQKDAGSEDNGRGSNRSTTNLPKNCHMQVAPETGVSKKDGILSASLSEGHPVALGSLQNGLATEQESGSVSTAILSTLDVLPKQKWRLEESENRVPFEMDMPKETLVLEPSETPVLLVPQPGPSSLGGTVNLILSLGKKAGREVLGSQVGASPAMGQEAVHKYPETKSSACKTFWKRCQGLLGNTLGSLKRKKRPPHRAKEVSTYLHVTEKDGDRDGGMSHESSTARQQHAPKQHLLRAASSTHPSTGWGPSAFHTLPKVSSGCFLQSLARKGKAKAGDAELLTLQGILGPEPNALQMVSEEKPSTSSTWPPKCSRWAQRLQALSPPHREPADYMKNPLAGAIDAECGSAEASGQQVFPRQSGGLSSPQSPPEKVHTCQHLPLGSVLSLELPKDPTALKNVHDAIRVASDGVTGRKGQSQAFHVAQENAGGAKAQANVQRRAPGGQLAMHQRPIQAGDSQHAHPKNKEGTWFEEVSLNPGYNRQKAHFVAPCEEDGQSTKRQSSSSDDFQDFKQNRLSRISVLHEQIGWEWDKLAASLGTTGSTSEVQARDPGAREAAWVKLKPSPVKHSGGGGGTSPTARAKDLPMSKTPEEEGPPSSLPPGFKSPTKLSVLECARGQQESIPGSSGLGPLILAAGGNVAGGPKFQDMAEVCHPAHELFEEEEEELQAIWSNVEKHKRNTGVCGAPAKKVDKVQSPDNSGGKLILTSADNLLVAKFKLPSSALLLQSSEGESRTSSGLDRKSSPNRCWASITSCEEASKGAGPSPMVPLQSSCPVDQQKLQEESRSLGKIPPSKLELQMMEGSLERKHLLQPGGRKANCRSWNTFHTVLMRQTLCFYQDKKDTLKSSVMALPLNLSGAVCTLETEYTKKNNCFTLQLKDGSKYLLRAPTESLMKEWITKLQQNSGLTEVDYFQSASQTGQGMTSAVSVISGHGVSSHFLGLNQSLSAKTQEALHLPRSSVRLQLPYRTPDDPPDTTTAAPTGSSHGSAAVHTTEHGLRPCSPAESTRSQDSYICQEEDGGLVTNKRRSYSFTSATYQKITPLSVSKENPGVGSSYSVTLYIGEQAPAPPRPRCHSFIASPSGACEALGERSQGASPRQKNKSVFRKFFGKKD